MTAPTWGLVVETTVGTGERKHVEATVVAHVTGPREAALAELEQRARNHTPAHPLSPRRRRLLRQHDGFLLVVDGAWQSYVTRFTVAELLEDSAAPAASPLAPGSPRAPGPPSASGERDEDGIPIRPSWLGRHDLR
ncbi:hypothetical protein [Streptomyces termitum]|uniref:hypothetical protein n=1 Tax=Streptomyces termitum TaxID=67368 RepID=UPI00378F5369